MILKQLVVATALFTVTPLSQALDFSGLPPAKSVSEARSMRAARTTRILEGYAALPLTAPPVPPKVGLDPFMTGMISRMILKRDLNAVSQNLLTPTFHPWQVGTEMTLISSGICHRMGDYDFVMQSLVRMAYIDNETPVLSPAARAKLRHELLSQTGNQHHVKFTFDDCIGFKITDSENHILQTESARYLTNQLLLDETGRAEYDNEKNGNNAWILNHLSQFLREDFSELNSRPYQAYSMVPIANLASYARDARVKTAATMVLDYLYAKIGLQSQGLRRRAPLRRQKQHRDDDSLMESDGALSFVLPDTGNYEFLALQSGNKSKLELTGYNFPLIMGATDLYETTDGILDLFTSPKPNYQRFHGRDVEVYAPSTNFTIGGGGVFKAQFGFFTGENDHYAVSTIVIPAHSGTKRSEMFYIDGPSDWNKRNNLCVAPNFACGENFHAPIAATFAKGGWSFYSTDDFYLAAYQEKQYAMMEVREKDQLSLEQFANAVLAKNSSMKLAKKMLSTYELTSGHRVTFTPATGDLVTFPIAALDGQPLERETAKWPFLQGSVMTSTGDGRIVIANAGERLTLDMRNPLAPVRTLEKSNR